MESPEYLLINWDYCSYKWPSKHGFIPRLIGQLPPLEHCAFFKSGWHGHGKLLCWLGFYGTQSTEKLVTRQSKALAQAHLRRVGPMSSGPSGTWMGAERALTTSQGDEFPMRTRTRTRSEGRGVHGRTRAELGCRPQSPRLTYSFISVPCLWNVPAQPQCY